MYDNTPEAAIVFWVLHQVLSGLSLNISKIPLEPSWEKRKGTLLSEKSVVVPWSIEDEIRLFTEEEGRLDLLGHVVGRTIKLPRCLTQEECKELEKALNLKSGKNLSHGDFFSAFKERDPSYCFGWLRSIDKLIQTTLLNSCFY